MGSVGGEGLGGGGGWACPSLPHALPPGLVALLRLCAYWVPQVAKTRARTRAQER